MAMLRTFCWRGLDRESLEFLSLRIDAHGVSANSSIIMAAQGYRLDHVWDLTPDWRARVLRIIRHDAQGQRTLILERDGATWRVDGAPRPDLDGADEPDLSITPFCNTLVIRRVPAGIGASVTADTAYVDGDALTVARSRQRYDRKGPRLLRYVDLGLSAGFEAALQVDEDGLVRHYGHLFARVT